MTIRIIQQWNGYAPDQIVSGLGSTEEARLIALGFASADLDGPDRGGEIAKFVTDASGNVTGQLLPSGDTLKLNPPKGKKIAILGNSIVFYNAIPNNSGLSGWVESTAKALTNTVVPVHMDLSGGFWPHLYYTCTTAGTTGTIEPTWPTTVGGTVTDGTVVWTATAVRSDAKQFGFGYFTFAQMLSGQRLDEVYICGRSGKQSDSILLYVDTALAANPDVVFFANMFENDCWPGVAPTLSTVLSHWNDVEAAMDRVRGLGKTVMLQTVLPSGNIDASSTFTGYVAGNGTKAWNWLNDKIREYARNNPDVIFWDAASVYVDSNPANPVWPENTVTYLSSTGTGQQLKKTDGVHPYTSGIWLLAQSLATIIAANFPAVDRFSYALDSYAIAVNPLNYGTSGTAGTGITSGTPANLMTANAYGTVTTAALTKVARTDRTGNWQRSTYVATAGDNLSYGPTSGDATKFAVGAVVQALSEINIEANPTLLTYPVQHLRFTGASGSDQYVYSATLPGSTWQDVGQMITTDTTLTMKTVPVKVPTGTTSLITYTKAYGRGASNFAAQFGRINVLPGAASTITDIS